MNTLIEFNFSALRRDLRDILTVMLYDDDSSSDSSDEEDFDVLFVVTAFGERRILKKSTTTMSLQNMFRSIIDLQLQVVRDKFEFHLKLKSS